MHSRDEEVQSGCGNDEIDYAMNQYVHRKTKKRIEEGQEWTSLLKGSVRVFMLRLSRDGYKVEELNLREEAVQSGPGSEDINYTIN